MIDFNYLWFDFSCPNCGYAIDFQLIDAKAESSVICHNCKSVILLSDSDASVHSGIECMNNAMKDIEQIFKQF